MKASARYFLSSMRAWSEGQIAFSQSGWRGFGVSLISMGLGQWLGLLFTCLSLSAIAASPEASTNVQQIAVVKARMDAAIARVKQIVNQPVVELRREPGMHVWTCSPGWFDPGALKPDFKVVDVRKTQEFPYRKYQYVTSVLNPGVVFLASQLEFNPMTEYFYTDRSVPKKKLTEAEMLEINKLYRVIGRCADQLVNLEHPLLEKRRLAKSLGADKPQVPPPLLATIHRFIFTHKPVAVAVVGSLLVLVILLRIVRTRKSAD